MLEFVSVPKSTLRCRALNVSCGAGSEKNHFVTQRIGAIADKPNTYPARIHALLAKDCDLGVVFRRGPSNHFATFLWERAHDVFRLGEWRKGRLYERRADISPDGKHLVYLASNYKYGAKDAGAWTNISQVPFLKPLDTYRTPSTDEGGGLFLSNTTYWLHAIWLPDQAQFVNSGLKRERNDAVDFGGRTGCSAIYNIRLVREGWRRGGPATGEEYSEFSTFEKRLPGGWVLRKIVHMETGTKPKKGRGFYWDEHQLCNLGSGS